VSLRPSASVQRPSASVHPSASLHASAIVAEGAAIGANCRVGPFCTIGPNVVLGEGCELVSHVVLDGHTTFGARNRIFSFACLGIAPQDLKYAGEPTRLEVGDDNSIREYVTISRGTEGGGGTTHVGSGCLIMAYTHIGHDSSIGNGCILANSATLAGHVIVEDYAVVGALCPIHQYCRIGRYSYIGGGTTITQDVLPYSLTSIERNNHAYGLNKVGLQRRGFTAEQLRELATAMRLLTSSKRNTTQALEAIEEMLASGTGAEHVKYLADFVASSERGVIK
jgi:UDP-N-acetylglucosamine acyltransferase